MKESYLSGRLTTDVITYTTCSINGDVVVRYNSGTNGPLITYGVQDGRWVNRADPLTPTGLNDGEVFTGVFGLSGDGTILAVVTVLDAGGVTVRVHTITGNVWTLSHLLTPSTSVQVTPSSIYVNANGRFIGLIGKATPLSELTINMYTINQDGVYPEIPETLLGDNISVSSLGNVLVLGKVCNGRKRGTCTVYYYNGSKWATSILLDRFVVGTTSTVDGAVAISGDGTTVVAGMLTRPPSGAREGVYRVMKFTLGDMPGVVTYDGAVLGLKGCPDLGLPIPVTGMCLCNSGKTLLVFGVNDSGAPSMNLHIQQSPGVWDEYVMPATMDVVLSNAVSRPFCHLSNDIESIMVIYPTPYGVERSSILKG